MIILPAIDLKDGKCVRLYKGDFSTVHQVSDDPLQTAAEFQTAGAEWIHMVDLDGAKDGVRKNGEIVREVCMKSGMKVELGGGIRTMEDIEARLTLGVARVILGTVALTDPDLVRRACARYPGRIACGIDAKDGRVAVRGWVEASDVDPVDLALRMKDAGVLNVIYTDIRRDGMQTGPNVEATAELVRRTGLRVIGSGGVGKIQDLYDLRDAGCAGAIVGKALYNGNFTLAQALRLEAE